MRTTVTIDDDLLRAAKVLAAKEDRSMSSVLEEALRALLDRSQANEAERRAAFDLPVFGGTFTVDPNDNAGLRDAMERG
jgi:metal-responsive CopG/Arc/MetJ family transcriptional regulator